MTRWSFQFSRNSHAIIQNARSASLSFGRSTLRDVFNAPSREDAERLLGLMIERHRDKAPKLADWLEKAVPDGFAVFALPVAHHRRLRSTNLIESINSQVRRRTRVAGLFPNESSLLRLVSAVLMEISEEWETGRRYLPEGDG